VAISELESVSRELVLVEGQEFGGVFIYDVALILFKG
jgi:hypothetical protein